MVQIVKTDTFDKWLSVLKDRQAKVRILVRIDRLAMGNAGDVKPVGDGISEMRIPYGPGYRIYYQQSDPINILLLWGGDKSTQQRDIQKAKEIAQKLKE